MIVRQPIRWVFKLLRALLRVRECLTARAAVEAVTVR